MIPDVHGVNMVNSSSKQILNARRGIVGNYIPKKDMFEYMQSTFHLVANHLSEHCGPYSKYALVVSPSAGKYETNIFTKDGKNIINSIEFSSPIEEIFKEMLLYIASRVDNKAGDGTTSSMILASRFFEFIATIYKDKNISSRDFSEQYMEFHKEMSKALNFQKITIDKLVTDIYGKDDIISTHEYQLVVATIAAYQALTSSGGDTELAKAMFEIYYHSPRECWNYTDVKHNKLESTERYSVDIPDNDFFLNNCTILDTSVLNTNLGTEYHSGKKKSDILVLVEDRANNELYTETVCNYLKFLSTDPDRTNDLVILSMADYGAVRHVIARHNAGENKFKMVFISHSDKVIPSSKSMHLIGLALSCGIVPFEHSNGHQYLTDAFVIPNATLVYKFHKVYIDDVLEEAAKRYGVEYKSGIVNPFFEHPEANEYYTGFLNLLDKHIEQYKTDVNQDRYYHTINAISDLKNVMTSPRRPRLVVGGNSHDHASAIDVVVDVCGAINAALTYGFTVGSSHALLRACAFVNHGTTNIFGSAISLACQELIFITGSGVKPVSFGKTFTEQEIVLNGTVPFSTNTTHLGKYNYANYASSHAEFNMLDVIKAVVLDNTKLPFMEVFDKINDRMYPILQPCTVFEQLFERIGDLMIKLITTDSIIVPGAVYVREEPVSEPTVVYGIEPCNGYAPSGSSAPVHIGTINTSSK